MNNKLRKLKFIRFKNRVRLQKEMYYSFKMSNLYKDDTEYLDTALKENASTYFKDLNKKIKAKYNYNVLEIIFNYKDDDFVKDLTTFIIKFKRAV